MSVFKKELTYLSKTFVTGEDGNAGEWKEDNVIKTATFKELDQTDRSQRSLQFLIISLGESTKNGQINMSTVATCDIAESAIETLLVPDADFSEQDKKEFFADNLAVLKFGLWFVPEKFMPFFLKFKTT